MVIKNWFALKEKQLALEKENHRVKLASLKAQINPHFLFNSLNNIYGVTASENKLSRAYILKLSDALRYMIYDTTEELVPLEKEVTYLENYIALEKLRMEEKAIINFQWEGDFSGYLIAPLILLPLVENCFKHYDKNNPVINIQLHFKQQLLVLQTTNNCIKEETGKTGGLGLGNLKNRLQLIYHNQYQLRSDIEEGIYKSYLEINLD